MLRVFSVFKSIQGESTRQGLACAFVRLAGCPFHCVYCDSRPACESDGQLMSIDDIITALKGLGVSLVEVTGGEPLAQDETLDLLSSISDVFPQVMLETSGSFSLKGIDPRVFIVMDVKCPDSGISGSFFNDNINIVKDFDHEIKFVISSREDFDWSLSFCHSHELFGRELLFSPACGMLEPVELAQWVIDSLLPIRLQLQLHQFIWPFSSEER